jgi:hypothetical protein
MTLSSMFSSNRKRVIGARLTRLRSALGSSREIRIISEIGFDCPRSDLCLMPRRNASQDVEHLSAPLACQVRKLDALKSINSSLGHTLDTSVSPAMRQGLGRGMLGQSLGLLRILRPQFSDVWTIGHIIMSIG